MKNHFFGKLPRYGAVALNMAVADKLFGALIFNKPYISALYKMANGYKSKVVGVTAPVSVSMTFEEYTFHVNDLGQAERQTVNVTTTLMPVSTEAVSGEGGALPDFEKLTAAAYSAEALENLMHFQSNFDHYGKEAIFRKLMHYGEVASVLRALNPYLLQP